MWTPGWSPTNGSTVTGGKSIENKRRLLVNSKEEFVEMDQTTTVMGKHMASISFHIIFNNDFMHAYRHKTLLFQSNMPRTNQGSCGWSMKHTSTFWLHHILVLKADPSVHTRKTNKLSSCGAWDAHWPVVKVPAEHGSNLSFFVHSTCVSHFVSAYVP